MLGNAIDDAKTYSSGELAQACGVTVRTVQYYDEKGLLPPADLTEGGRRVYTEADAAKLRKILLLKRRICPLPGWVSFFRCADGMLASRLVGPSSRVLRVIAESC